MKQAIRLKVSETCREAKMTKKGWQPRTDIVKGWEECFGYGLPQYVGLVEESFLSVIELTWG